MPLDIRKDPSLVPSVLDSLINTFAHGLLQPVGVSAVTASKPVEVHQGRNGIEDVKKGCHVCREPFHGDIATSPSASSAEQNRLGFDPTAPQVRRKNRLDELFLCLPFHGDSQADHGRPPRRFFNQRSPGA